ncbi:MAG: Gamma-D-glutamyl-L-lysine dipeptidyl-peptidase [Chlamydiales bacterium]|nr:Gamma-D-glutamyl-L-lysine dipeptidyl-peptidase [Chlamydiales bacterium]MCH9620226.1 Gamma-D-glutamyl-L-lysine dipeptidyl-peptidase [Chlamydiales bacterium]MCH9623059.1 Gamma-D-glutamyl-L-lysine dipeptidyl-peptidase [Chlamydiales bacterium]
MFYVNQHYIDLRENGGIETQLIYGERVDIEKKEGERLKVRACEQFDYPGWILGSEVQQLPPRKPTHVVHTFETKLEGNTLSYGTYLTEEEAEKVDPKAIRPIPKQIDRDLLIKEAKQFLGLPYLWGGRSSAGVDCSGFISLLFRAQGLLIPRNTKEQQRFGEKSALAPGALIYTEKHVVLYLGENLCIEAPETGRLVSINPCPFQKGWNVRTFLSRHQS